MVSRPLPAYEGDSRYFFISYSHDDAELVYPELAWLQEAEFNLWYDDGIHVGTSWRQALADAVADSSGLVFFATARSVKSGHCLREINFALDDEKPVFVVQLDDADLPRQMRLAVSDRQALVRSNLDEKSYRDRLYQALSSVVKPESSSPCIAVFPFANLGGDDNADYFSDGLTDELINGLAQIEKLRVVSRTSVFEFKGRPTDICVFGKRLGATAVLEGSVRSLGSKVRVTFQLTNVADGLTLWSGRLDREVSDIFAIQDQITQAIVNALPVNLVPGRARDASVCSEHTLQAYDLYLRGKYAWNRQTEASMQDALQYFGQSTKIDPNLAVAHAGIADVYSSLAFHGFLPTRDALPKARVAAKKALAINHTLPDANISMAFVEIFLDRDWIEAEAYLRRTIELNPSSARAYYYLTVLLLQQRQLDQGRVAIQKAIELDPLNVMIHTAAGWAEYYAGSPGAAIAVLDKALKIDKDYPEIQIALAAAFEQLGDSPKAIQHVQAAVDAYGFDPLVMAFAGVVYGSTGQHDKAHNVLAVMDEIGQTRFVPATCRALVYMGLRDTENSIKQLELATEARDVFLSWMNVLPAAQWLREDPRFMDILERIGFEI